MRRIAYVLMSYPVVLYLVASDKARTSNLPADARVSHLVLLPERQQVQVFFESETLEPVPETGLIPEFDVILRTTA